MSDTGTVTPRTEAGDDDDWTPLMELRAYVAGIRGGGVPEVVCQSLIAFGRRIEDDTRARTLAAVEHAIGTLEGEHLHDADTRLREDGTCAICDVFDAALYRVASLRKPESSE